MSEEAKAAPAKKKKGRLLLVMVAALVVLLGGGGAGAYWWMHRGGPPAEGAAAAHAQAAHEEANAAAIPLPTFTVNLADKDASRYLRVTLALVTPDHEKAEELSGSEHAAGSVKLMKARSAILELLSTKTADELSTAEGKETLKKAIAERATKAFGAVKVSDVLFSEFVVQF